MKDVRSTFQKFVERRVVGEISLYDRAAARAPCLRGGVATEQSAHLVAINKLGEKRPTDPAAASGDADSFLDAHSVEVYLTMRPAARVQTQALDALGLLHLAHVVTRQLWRNLL